MLTDPTHTSHEPLPTQRFSLGQLQEATGGVLEGTAPDVTPLRRMICDSRDVQVGDVFWALPGEQVDGTQFVEQAFGRGAWGCVLAASQHDAQARGALESAQHNGARFLLWVDDVPKVLRQLAAWYRQRLAARVIAITGSVGKTTTRAMIHAALARRHRVKQSPKNYNNHLGVPLSLLQMERSDEFAVLELGASAAGEIAALAAIAQPHVAVITRIAQAHLEGFGSVEGVATAKAELLQALPIDGVAFINGDDPWACRIASELPCRVVLAGEQEHNDWIARKVESVPGKLSFEVRQRRARKPAPTWGPAARPNSVNIPARRIEIAATGRHHVAAAICAVAVAREMGVPLEEIIEGLSDFRPLPHRCEVIGAGDATLLDDTYNSSPASMTAALQVLGQWPTDGRKIVVAGDMCELGTDSRLLHRTTGAEIGRCADVLLAYGEFAPAVVQAARQVGMSPETSEAFDQLEVLCQRLREEMGPGDVVLVKGSRALGMEQVIEELSAEERRGMPAGMTQKPHSAPSRTRNPATEQTASGMDT